MYIKIIVTFKRQQIEGLPPYRHEKGVDKGCHSSHLNVLTHQSPSNDGGSVSGKGELCAGRKKPTYLAQSVPQIH